MSISVCQMLSATLNLFWCSITTHYYVQIGGKIPRFLRQFCKLLAVDSSLTQNYRARVRRLWLLLPTVRGISTLRHTIWYFASPSTLGNNILPHAQFWHNTIFFIKLAKNKPKPKKLLVREGADTPLLTDCGHYQHQLYSRASSLFSVLGPRSWRPIFQVRRWQRKM